MRCLCTVTGSSKRHGGGRVARESRFLLCDVTSPRPYTAASSTSLLHEPSSLLASRRASGPACRVLRMRVGREDPFSVLGNPERRIVSGRKLEASAWPAFSVFAGLPGAQKRRRVPAQHKGVPQRLHIIPRRGKRPVFPSFFHPLYTFLDFVPLLIPHLVRRSDTQGCCFIWESIGGEEPRQINNRVRGGGRAPDRQADKGGGGVREKNHSPENNHTSLLPHRLSTSV